MLEDIEEIKAQRSVTKGSITRIKTLIDSKGTTLTLHDLECRLGILESYFKHLLILQGSFEKLSKTDDSNVRANYEELYVSTKSSILSLISEKKKDQPGSELDRSIFFQPTTPILHKVKLPRFSGKYSEYPNFIGLFDKSVHKNIHYETIEKCNILVGSLDGLAKNAVLEFQISEANYPKILEQLNNRFDNKTLMFQELISELFELPKILKNSSVQLRSLVDNVNAIFSSMKSIGTEADIANAMIVYVVMNKLDPESQSRWEESLTFSEMFKWSDCAAVLSKRCQFLECRESKNIPLAAPRQYTNDKTKSPSYSRFQNSTTLTASQSSRNSCTFCNSANHNIYKCIKFADLPVVERFNKAKNLSLCINCLMKGHSVKKCTSSKCRVCSSPHHSLLHRYNNNSSSLAENNPSANSHTYSTSSHVVATTKSHKASKPTLSEQNNVILATAVINICDNFGTLKPVRALLDSGSQSNFMTESLVHSLQLKKSKLDQNICGIGNSKTKVRYFTNATVQSCYNDFKFNSEFLLLPSISGILPDSNLLIKDWNIPNNIKLADPNFHKQQKVDLLIGAESFFEILSVGQIKLGPSLPTLQKTLLGWIVSGKYNLSYMPNSNHYSNFASTYQNDSVIEEITSDIQNENLSQLVQQFWKMESFADNLPILSKDQQYCEDFFVSNTNRSSSGHIVTKLPFKNSNFVLGDSFKIAEKRFYNLEKKLNRDVSLKQQYSEFLNEYELLNHMELVPQNKEHLVKYYLPHHCVLKLDSSSTKLRVVFDGSCKTTSNTSLNDVLMIGPTVQDDLVSILLRFRCHKYALKADICKMYRQVYVTENDSFYQCILWRENANQRLKTYRLKTVTYGTASASFLATRALTYLANQNKTKFPSGSHIITKDFYVDDLITGGSSIEEITKIRTEVDAILKSGQMELKKWYSNDDTFLSNIPISDREKLISIDGSSFIKTLGVVWQPSTDQFRFIYDSNTQGNEKITKRTVLADLARLFDPMGLINPVIVRAKIFMQNLWLLNLDWDESLPVELHTDWKQFKTQLSLINKINIPRYIFSMSTIKSYELHGFADASLRAYGCCIYIRSIDIYGNISVNLLTAKSRISPSKAQSIPRLELCSALLLANLIKKVSYNIKNYDRILLWSDSEIVLAWLASHSLTLNIFVSNRVSQIQELTEGSNWRHVNSESNAADILSRGATVEELLHSKWYNGPDFLQKSEEFWPPKKIINSNMKLPDLRRKDKFSLLETSPAKNNMLEIIEKSSNYQSLVKIFGFVMRFIYNCRSKSKNSNSSNLNQNIILSPIERETSLFKIIYLLQRAYFMEDIDGLQTNGHVSTKSSIKCLNPFLDNTDNTELLRVGGRLDQSNIPYSAKHPILLPRNHLFVRLLIEHLHIINLHVGPQALLAIIRQRFWIINGKPVISNVVRNCIRCFLFKPKLLNQMMGDLPKERLSPTRAFLVSGVDFCGPIMVSPGIRGKRVYKAYIAVFVCFSTHAIHLEVVSSLSADAFIASLKRFVARRGLCNRIYCDNGTNFVGARRSLEQLRQEFLSQQNQNIIASWCSQQGVSFHHIPARSPHFGGLWESAVKSAKHHLNRTLTGISLTLEELNTFTSQVEAILNSRPITPLSSDPSDEQALTPGHFLIGCPLISLPERDTTVVKTSLLKRFQRISTLQQHFWKRWSNEYIKNLQNRYKWASESKNIKIGTLVLISETNLPPQQWSLGRVCQTYPGKDNLIRVVDVCSKGKILRRQIHSLAPLPIYKEDIECSSTT